MFNYIRTYSFLFIGLFLTFNGFGQKEFLTIVNTHNLSGIAYSPDGKYLATGDWSETTKIWDTEKGTLFKTLPVPSTRIAYSPDGKYLASNPTYGPVSIWSVKEGLLLAKVTDLHGSNSICFSQDGKSIVCSYGVDQAIKIFNVSNGSIIKTFKLAYDPHHVTFSPDGKTIIAADWNRICIYNSSTGVLLKTFTDGEPKQGGNQITSMRYSPNGKFIVAGQSGVVQIWNVVNGTFKKLSGHGVSTRVCCSPDSKYIAVGDWSKTIKVWDVTNENLLQTLEVYTSLNEVCFSPDGKYLASSSEKTIKIWSLVVNIWDIPEEKPTVVEKHEPCKARFVKKEIDFDDNERYVYNISHFGNQLAVVVPKEVLDYTGKKHWESTYEGDKRWYRTKEEVIKITLDKMNWCPDGWAYE